MSLISPSGRVINRSTVAPDVLHDKGSGFEVYTIVGPEPGDWRVTLLGADVPPAGEDTVFGFTSVPSPTDTVPPTTVASVSPTSNTNGWNNTDTAVQFNAADNVGGSGVKSITFSATGAQTIPSTVIGGPLASVDVTSEGQTTITYFASDNAGNSETPHTITVKLDKTAPEATVQFDPLTKDIVVLGQDAGSGVKAGPIAPTSVRPIAGGLLRTYKVVDAAGNTLTIPMEVDAQGNSISTSIQRLQYNNGPLLAIAKNQLAFHWTSDRTGLLVSIRERLDVGTGSPSEQRQEVEFANGRSTVMLERPKPESVLVQPGLVLLRLVTNGGQLTITR